MRIARYIDIDQISFGCIFDRARIHVTRPNNGVVLNIVPYEKTVAKWQKFM